MTDALSAPTPDLRLAYARIREALEQCGEQFAFYAREHTAAGKHEKAATNQRFANLSAEALKATPLIGLSQGEGVSDAAEIVARILAPDRDVFFKGEPVVETARRIVAALSGLSLPGVADLSARVRRLVIAARVVAYSDGQTDMTELDQAAEAFAADIAWEDGNDA